ncbi:MAG: nitroreductase family protein [Candidatus Nanoarchaeia archaeon]|nr:nitroreductase family protein [Candidatus Nanoarchaeia archaeon]
MEALKAINTRRSIRKYQRRKIPSRVVKELIKAGANAPSSFNSQPWVFITTTDKNKMKQISEYKSQRSKFMADAPLLIACCYDETRAKTVHNPENVACAVENILIASNAMGIGTCYIGAFDPEYPEIEKSIIKAFRLPKHVKVVCLITAGYPDEKPKPKKMRKLSEIWKNEVF